MSFKALILKVLVLSLYSYISFCFDVPNQFDPNDFSSEPDNLKSVYGLKPELLQQIGYKCEEYSVTTPDGYILTIHRILSSPKEDENTSEKKNKQAVLLQHGLFLSSSAWILNAPDNSLACALADAGFDVWLGNQRGNEYGREHVHLNPTQSKFWNFSLDELANFDMPSIVEHIISIKDQESSIGDTHTRHHEKLFKNVQNKIIGETNDNIGHVISTEERNRQTRSINGFVEGLNSYFQDTFERLTELFSGTINRITDVIKQGEESWKNRQNITKNAIILIGQYNGALISMMQASIDQTFASKIRLLIAYGMPREGAMTKVPFNRLVKSIDVDTYFDRDVVLDNPNERFNLFKKLCDKRQDLINSMFGEPIDFLYFVAGKNNFIDKEKLPKLMPYLFTGTSKKVILHYAQLFRAGKIQSFIDSKGKNDPEEKALPFEYNFENINIPFSIISGHKEPENTDDGLLKLHSVPGFIIHNIIKRYGTYDFILSEQLKNDVIPIVMDLLKKI